MTRAFWTSIAPASSAAAVAVNGAASDAARLSLKPAEVDETQSSAAISSSTNSRLAEPSLPYFARAASTLRPGDHGRRANSEIAAACFACAQEISRSQPAMVSSRSPSSSMDDGATVLSIDASSAPGSIDPSSASSVAMNQNYLWLLTKPANSHAYRKSVDTTFAMLWHRRFPQFEGAATIANLQAGVAIPAEASIRWRAAIRGVRAASRVAQSKLCEAGAPGRQLRIDRLQSRTNPQRKWSRRAVYGSVRMRPKADGAA